MAEVPRYIQEMSIFNKRINSVEWMQGDLVIWMVFFLLFAISVVEVYSASSSMSYGVNTHYWEPLISHCFYWAVGIGAVFLIGHAPCNKLKYAAVFGFMFMLLLQFIALCSGRINGAGRWIHLWGFTFQPSEFIKPLLIAFAAFFFSQFRDEKGVSAAGFKIVATVVLITLLMIVTENLSTAVLIGAVMYLMAFVARVHGKYLITILTVAAVVAAAGWTFAHSVPESTLQEWHESNNFVLHRVPTWVHRLTDKHEIPDDPKDYDLTDNVQKTHAYIAVATSHGIGKGPGKSRQRDYLPQAYSDFIYAIIIEEWGIVGALAVMALYLILMWRCKVIASRCKSLFPSYLVMGLAMMMGFQALLNMAVAVGAFPVTGQTLPLVSKGGTSILANCLSIGMILSVSRTAKRIDAPDAPSSSAPADDAPAAVQPA